MGHNEDTYPMIKDLGYFVTAHIIERDDQGNITSEERFTHFSYPGKELRHENRKVVLTFYQENTFPAPNPVVRLIHWRPVRVYFWICILQNRGSYCRVVETPNRQNEKHGNGFPVPTCKP